MDKAGLDLTLGRLGKNVARPEISYVQLLDNESFPETSTQQLPSQTCWSLECSYKGNDQVLLFYYWIQQNYRDLTSFLF